MYRQSRTNIVTMHSWQLQEAKNKLSELIRKAQVEGLQTITKHGEHADSVQFPKNVER